MGIVGYEKRLGVDWNYMMIKRSAAILFASMTDSGAEFDEATNTIDLTQMAVSDGELEAAAAIVTAQYTVATGDLNITWDPTTFTNGKPTDMAFILVVKRPLLQSAGVAGTWYPDLFMYGSAIPVAPPGIQKIRSDTWMTITIPAGLTAADLTAYIFFRDSLNEIGYSESLGQVPAAI